MTKKTKCTPEMIELTRKNAKLGFTYQNLAQSLGISEDTFYSWVRKGRDEGTQPYCSWYAALKESEAELLATCLEQLQKSISLGNTDSCKFLLQTRFNYAKSSSVDVKAKTEAVNINFNSEMTAEGVEAIRKDIISKLTPKTLPEGY